MEGMNTLQDMYNYIRKSHSRKDFIGTREKNEDGSLGQYVFETYEDIIQQADWFGSGIRFLNLCPEICDFQDFKCKFLSIFAPNMPMWFKMDIGAMLHGLTLAPLYNTLGPESIAYVMN